MKKPIFITILISLLTCVCFSSCSDDKGVSDKQKFDLTKFTEIKGNATILKISNNTSMSDSCIIKYECSGYRTLKVFNEDKQQILELYFNPENYSLGDSISAITMKYYENSDISFNNAAIRIYGYKHKQIQKSLDSIYLDAVFHIKFDDQTKDIKGQILYKDTMRIDELLCL